MSVRILLIAILPALAAFPNSFVLHGAERMTPDVGSQRYSSIQTGANGAASQTPSQTSRHFPGTKLAALGAAVQVVRIQEAYPATNDDSHIRTHRKPMSEIGNTRAPAAPSAAALAVLAASEPRAAAPTMKPFVDSQVVTASYSTQTDAAQPVKAVRPEPNSSAENPLRESGTMNPFSRSPIRESLPHGGTNPLR